MLRLGDGEGRPVALWAAGSPRAGATRNPGAAFRHQLPCAPGDRCDCHPCGMNRGNRETVPGHVMKHSWAKARCVGEREVFLGVRGPRAFCEPRKPPQATDDALAQVPASFSFSLKSQFSLVLGTFPWIWNSPQRQAREPCLDCLPAPQWAKWRDPGVPGTVIPNRPHMEKPKLFRDRHS